MIRKISMISTKAVEMTNKYRLEIILILFLFIIRIVIISSPFEFLLEHTLGDDAFYYFGIAKNMAHGLGSTFDGISPTNGYHPLWLIIILPLFTLLKSPVGVIYVVLFIAAVMDTITIAFIYLICRRLKINRWIALIACIVYGLSPLIIFSTSGPFNGVETGVNTLMVTIYGWVYLRLIQSPETKSSDYMLFGIVSAFCFLARTDNAIMLAIFSIQLAVSFRQHPKKLRYLIVSFLGAGLLIAPWLIFSYTQFGSIIQVSGRAIAFQNKDSLLQEGWTSFNYIMQWLANLLKGIFYTFGFLVPRTVPEYVALTLASIPLITFVTFRVKKLSVQKYIRTISTRTKDYHATSVLFLVLIVFIYMAFISTHTIRAVFLRPWYYGSTVTLMIVVSAYVLNKLIAPLITKNIDWIHISMLILVLTIQGVSLNRLLASDNQGELRKWAMVQEMNRILPQQSIVGAWNAGLYGYFFEKGNIVNLDGVVNNATYPYIQNHAQAEYAELVSIKYIVDETHAPSIKAGFWRDDQTSLIDELSPVVTQKGITLWEWKP